MATVVRENLGLLNDKLTVKISKDDYLPSFEKKLKQYGKTANIPGFRKGMVPTSMIKKMYGTGIFTEEVIRSAEAELHKWLTAEQPDIFAQPLPLVNSIDAFDMNNPADYSFDFEIGLKPAFEIADLSKGKFTNYKVEATADMVDEEVNRLQIKGGNMTEPEIIDNPENVINILFAECTEAGDVIEGGISKENSVLLKYFSAALQKSLMGKKKEDSIVFQLSKAFETDKLHMMLQDLGFEKNDTLAAKKYFKASIVKIGLVEKRELNEAFFNEIYPGKILKTEADFRNTIKEDIQQYWSNQGRTQFYDQLYHYLVEETTIEFPANFLKRWMQTNNEQPKTAEQAETEWPNFSNQLKWTLISDKLTQDNKLEATPEEIKESMREEVMRYFGQMNMNNDMGWLDSYIDRMMKDEKQVEASYRRITSNKVFELLESKISPVEKIVSAEELTAIQHNHQH